MKLKYQKRKKSIYTFVRLELEMYIFIYTSKYETYFFLSFVILFILIIFSLMCCAVIVWFVLHTIASSMEKKIYINYVLIQMNIIFLFFYFTLLCLCFCWCFTSRIWFELDYRVEKKTNQFQEWFVVSLFYFACLIWWYTLI
jgi:hypothetical protein